MKNQGLRFFICTELSETTGFGNVIRGIELLKNFAVLGPSKLSVLTTQKEIVLRLLPKEFSRLTSIHETVADILPNLTAPDFVIIDSPTSFASEISKRIKMNFPNSKTIALDYFQDLTFIDFRISIFDQSTKSFQSSSRSHLVGLEYAIISPKLRILEEESKSRTKRDLIIVRSSGENSRKIQTATDVIKSLFAEHGFEVANFDSATSIHSPHKILKQDSFLPLLAECALYIGSGVTTLFECSILRTPCIFVGSNNSERKFTNALARKTPLTLLDVNHPKFQCLLTEAVKKFMEIEDKYDFIPRIEVDSSGAQRIVEIINRL